MCFVPSIHHDYMYTEAMKLVFNHKGWGGKRGGGGVDWSTWLLISCWKAFSSV